MTLAEDIDRLRGWLHDNLGAPPIDDGLVVELTREEIAAPELTLAADRLRSPSAFEERWAELHSRGYSWINLSCYGLHGRTMIVAVELPREPTRASRTSVVFSGPPIDSNTRQPRWDANDRIRVVG